jgi:hypothetical protein
VQERAVFIEPFAEMIGNHFESGSESAGVEVYGLFPANDPIALVPPGRVGITHDLAHAVIEQQTLNRSKEWEDLIPAGI